VAPPEPTVAGPLRIGRYEVISHLATGGMAQIYLARQTGLGSFERHVVLKTILRERAQDQRFVTMFLDEAKLAATLNHQNVAQVYEVDQADGAYFMAMEYVHGENTRAILETTIRRGWTIPLELAVMIISGAAAGLHHAHERRGKNGQPLHIVHRDVSPANIMVGYDGSVKVLDFGIAKAEERATQTIGGTIKGKYGYMSPEQCKGKPIDRRSDIFALGIVLYELTTLRRAFKGKDDFETMKRIVAGDMVLPSTVVPGFPRELEAIILTALANDPGARFQSAQELIEALDAFTVRAKLTGSNTAMGRFMLQLFGTKKEPWIDVTSQSSDHTLVTPSELEDYEDDNDETLVVSSRQDVQRALAYLNMSPQAAAPPPSPAPSHATAHPSPHTSAHAAAHAPAHTAAHAPAHASAHAPAHTSAHAPAHTSAHASGPVSLPQLSSMQPAPTPSRLVPDTDTGSRSAAEAAKRPTVRRSADRPSLPFANPSAATPPQPTPLPPTGMPQAGLPSQMMTPQGMTPQGMAPQGMAPQGMAPQGMAPQGMGPLPPMTPQLPPMGPQLQPMPPPPTTDHARPSKPHLSATIIGPVPLTVPPPAMSGLPQLVANDEISQISSVGSTPLVNDPKLGWETAVKLIAPDGGHTRLADPVDFRLRSNATWIVLAIMFALAVVVIVVAMLES
jgi:eukaryotic-like serine/threonine-protein kinase